MESTLLLEFWDCCKINVIFWISFYAPVYLLYEVIFPSSFHSSKFNPKYSSKKLLIQEIFFSFIAVVIASIIETFIYHYKYIDYDNTVTLNDIHTADSWSSSLWIFYNEAIRFQVLFIILFEDFQFYAYHRLLHEVQFLWINVHKFHHKSYNPNAFSGLSFHPIESILYLSPLCIAMVMDISSAQFAVFKFLLIVGPIPGHNGYGNKGLKDKENKSAGFDFVYILSNLFLANDAYFHYIHHANFKYNFGSGLTPIWDKVMGTEYPYTAQEHFSKITKER